MSGPIVAAARDGGRIHLQHGPIDLIIEVSGSDIARRRAHDRASGRFSSILDELVPELSILRRPLGSQWPQSAIGRRMAGAVAPLSGLFITPMAAVAGAVADDVLAAMLPIESRDEVERIFVNNGGDIALYLGPGTRYDVGLVPHPRTREVVGKMVIHAADPVRGIATSGRHGRSMSLGIADAVTVLAYDAAAADVAATLIANAVDLPGHRAVERVPASDIDPDTDLGDRWVTVGVGDLSKRDIDKALEAGRAFAGSLVGRGHIVAAVLALGGRIERVGHPTGPKYPAAVGGIPR